MADERKKKYTPFWEKDNEAEHRLSDDQPDIHVYISRQISGFRDGGTTKVNTLAENTKQQKTTD